MKYFNGFSLQNEEKLFQSYVTEDDYSVVGFSYGAQQAFEYAYHSTQRINRLILLSPAFFQTEKPSFVRTQLRYFEADIDAYVKKFLDNVSYPSSTSLSPYLKVGKKEELSSLLSYKWDSVKIQTLRNRGITIEVFIGECDKIIKSKEAIDFFRDLSTVYIIKKSGHLLEF